MATVDLSAYVEMKRQRDELQAAYNESFRVLEWVLAELQAMNAGADPKFRKFFDKLSKKVKP